MRWSEAVQGRGFLPTWAFASCRGRAVFALLLLVLLVWPLTPEAQLGAPERLSIYTPRGSFSVPLQAYSSRRYLPLQELLGPMGEVSARQDGRKWKVRFNGEDLEFELGNSRAKVEGKALELPSQFLLQDGKGMVPLAGLVPLLSPLLEKTVELHESALRLFVDGVAVHFNAQLVHAPADSVVLTFSAPVNPSIATEPGRLRMTFVHEPLLHPSPSTANFDNKSISSLTYREGEGVAELTLNSAVPLLARFSPDRKTITVGPVVQIIAQARPAAPAAPSAAAPSPAAPSQPPAASAAVPPVATPAPAAPPPVVVIDARHGGTELGAALSDTLAEKDITLGIALRLHNDLEARGLRTMLLRASDTALTLDQRAILANTSRARFYLSIHAGSMGTGVRLYTALLPPITPATGPFLPWDSAQATYLSSSLALSKDISAEFAKVSVPARQMPAPVPPLNHIAAAAVAVEVAPPGADVSQLTSPAYQEQVASAITAGVVRAQQGGAP